MIGKLLRLTLRIIFSALLIAGGAAGLWFGGEAAQEQWAFRGDSEIVTGKVTSMDTRSLWKYDLNQVEYTFTPPTQSDSVFASTKPSWISRGLAANATKTGDLMVQYVVADPSQNRPLRAPLGQMIRTLLMVVGGCMIIVLGFVNLFRRSAPPEEPELAIRFAQGYRR